MNGELSQKANLIRTARMQDDHNKGMALKRNSISVLKPDTPRKKIRVYISAEAQEYDRNSCRVLLENVANNECKWPVNSPEPGGKFLFCGSPATSEHHYCAHHVDRATASRPGKLRKKKKISVRLLKR